MSDYLTFVFKDTLGQPTTTTLTSIVRTDRLPSTSTVYLQVFNYTTASWETVDSDNSSPVNTNFTLTGTIPSVPYSITDYLDGDVITSRIYQEKK